MVKLRKRKEVEKKCKLKKYIGFSRSLGQEEVAVLIFAESLKQAKKLLVKASPDFITDFLDIGLKLLGKGYEHLDENKEFDVPHIVYEPKSCKMCNHWGSPLQDGYCEDCYERARRDTASMS